MERVKHNGGFEGFVKFLKEQGVFGLAIGLVLGGAAATLVNSLINNVIMPPIGLLLGSPDGLRGLAINMGTKDGVPAMFRYGQFLSDMINFIVIALVVYLIIKALHLNKEKKV